MSIARTAFEEALETCCQLGDISLASNVLAGLGDLDIDQHDDEAGFAHLSCSLVFLEFSDLPEYELAIRITQHLYQTLITRPAVIDRATPNATDLYRSLIRHRSAEHTPDNFVDAVALKLSELVGRGGMLQRRDQAELCLETLQLWSKRGGDSPDVRLAVSRGLRNAIVLDGRSGERQRAESRFAELKQLATDCLDDVAVQEQFAASLVSIINYRLTSDVPATGVVALISCLYALQMRFPDDARFAAYVGRAEEQFGFRRARTSKRVSKHYRTLIDLAIASPDGLNNLFSQIDPFLFETLDRQINHETSPDRCGQLAALKELLTQFCEAIANGARGTAERPPSLPLDHRSSTSRDTPSANAYALATVTLRVWLQTKDPKHLDTAVSLLQRAITDSGTDDRTRTHARFLLGQSFVHRYDATGNFTDLELGLRHLLPVIEPTPYDGFPAIQPTPPDDPERPKRLEFFANSLLRVLDRMSPAEARSEVGKGHLRHVISSLEESVRLTAAGDPALPWRLSSLALALKHRFEHSGNVEFKTLKAGQWTGGDIKDLDQAADNLRQAAAATLLPEQLEGIYGNLGTILLFRYEATNDRDSLASAIDAYQRAAAESSPESPSRGHHLENLARALAQTDADAASVDKAFDDAFLAMADRRSPSPQLGNVHSSLRFLLDRGARAEIRGHWKEAAASYAEAQRQLDALVGAQVTRRFQTRQLAESMDIPVKYAYALARAGDPEAAMMALERGRARLLSEALAMSDIDPDQLRAAGRSDLADALAEAVANVQQLENSALNPDSGAYLVGSDKARSVRARLQNLTNEIQASSDLQHVISPLAERDIRRLIAGQSVVYLAAADSGGMALVVPPEPSADLIILLMEDLTHKAVSQHATFFHNANRLRYSDRRAWMSAIDDSCKWLWATAMGPLLDCLAVHRIKQFSIVPCGWLGLLPLHAAWTLDNSRPSGRRYALDDAVVSYCANGRALATAQRRASGRKLLDDVLVINTSDSSGTELSRLLGTSSETGEIRRLIASASVLTGSEVSDERVLHGLQRCTLVHFACHGRSIPAQPLTSSLFLGGGTELKVHKIMATRLERARLAVLSACETAVFGYDAPDESIGLPGALLQAGTAGVVASLWAVPDQSTALLMQKFYRGLVIMGLSPIAALREAQMQLRDATNLDLVQEGCVTAPTSLSGAAARLWQAGRPFSHPYHWAAFSYTGV